MSTLVFFHAHPDDESSQTSGTMAKAVAEGHRVVVVYATNGDHGDAPEDLAPGETVVDRRHKEALESAKILGTARVEWLGYADSGMHGWIQNAGDNAFHGAVTDEAAQRLADILDDEEADIAVCYDWHGGYGHPDHVKVHNVMHRAIELAKSSPRLFEVTMNRDQMREMNKRGRELGVFEEGADFDPDRPMDDGNPLGIPASDISFYVDVADFIDKKRAALGAHASQSDARGLLAMPDAVFPLAFGVEHFIDVAEMEKNGRPSAEGHGHGSRRDDGPLPEGWFFKTSIN